MESRANGIRCESRSDACDVAQIILEPQEFAYHMDVPHKVKEESLINPAHLAHDVIEMLEARMERYAMRALLPCHKVATLTCPADWWSAFKARWFPAWARRRWPSRVTVVELQDYYRDVEMPDNGFRRFPLVLCRTEEAS